MVVVVCVYTVQQPCQMQNRLHPVIKGLGLSRVERVCARPYGRVGSTTLMYLMRRVLAGTEEIAIDFAIPSSRAYATINTREILSNVAGGGWARPLSFPKTTFSVFFVQKFYDRFPFSFGNKVSLFSKSSYYFKTLRNTIVSNYVFEQNIYFVKLFRTTRSSKSTARP